mmetsp:Transcript_2716/g.5780  ORF Transcript_2716/g.5780 Transcript_2716/m.5780 type:complete len:270 (+) Transcript_2716:141-950(+)
MARNAVLPNTVLGKAGAKTGSSKKKAARREKASRRRERETLVAAANVEKDLLLGFQPFRRYSRNGLNVRIECVGGDSLGPSDLDFCLTTLRDNMGDFYRNSSWGWDEKSKRAGMQDPVSRILLLREQLDENPAPEPAAEDDWVMVEYPDAASAPSAPSERNLGFVHLQFCIEDDRPVLYVLELQLVDAARGKGLGRFAMQLCELVARKHGMQNVMLTVFKSNQRAVDFYCKKLRYVIDESSPSVWERHDEDYEILSKSLEKTMEQERSS